MRGFKWSEGVRLREAVSALCAVQSLACLMVPRSTGRREGRSNAPIVHRESTIAFLAVHLPNDFFRFGRWIFLWITLWIVASDV